MCSPRFQGYGVPASAGGDPVGQGVRESSGDFGPGRFPPAEAGTPCLFEGALDRGLSSHIEDLGPEVTRTMKDGVVRSAISGVRSPGFSRWRSGGNGRVGKFRGPRTWKVSAG